MKPWHWIVVLIVVLLVFGAKRLPDIARSLGQSAKVLKHELTGLQEEGASRDEHAPERGGEPRLEADPRAASNPASNSADDVNAGGRPTPAQPPATRAGER